MRTLIYDSEYKKGILSLPIINHLEKFLVYKSSFLENSI